MKTLPIILIYTMSLTFLYCTSPATATKDPGMMKSKNTLVTQANAFLASLTEEQKEKALVAFEDDLRSNWHYLPVVMYDRNGISLKELSDSQDALAFTLLSSCLSQEGFSKAEQIIDLESVLQVLEPDNNGRDPEQYHVAIYGSPADKGAWGWSFQGHHLALHYTIVDGELVATPQFMGANPAEVRLEGPKKGLRVLAAEEDLGMDLVNALPEDQRKKAIFMEEAPYDIYTTNKSTVTPLDDLGVSYGEMSTAHKKMVDAIIDEFIAAMPEEVGRRRRAELREAGYLDIKFAWAGSTSMGAGHYYRLQGPTFLIEVDNTQNDANHIHCVWRDFNGDFGRDLIAEHRKTSQH